MYLSAFGALLVAIVILETNPASALANDALVLITNVCGVSELKSKL